MPLDEDVKGLLTLLESMDVRGLGASTPDEARTMFRSLTVDLRDPESVVDVGRVTDLEVDGAEGPLPARRYEPEGADRERPTIAFFHGGGFVIGDLDTHDNQARTLCRELDAVVVSVDYRLAPEHPHPAGVEDCLAATRWIAAHAGDLDGDPSRLVVAGDSAGGNLAAVVAQRCRDEHGPSLAAQLLIYPVVDLTGGAADVHTSRRENAEGYLLTANDMAFFEEHYLAATDPTHPHASPLWGQVDGLPPAVVVTAEYDPLRDEGEAYARKLVEAGVPVAQRRFDGLIHGFFGLGALSAACDTAVRETCGALQELLSGTPA